MPVKHISAIGQEIKSISEISDLSNATLTLCLHSNRLRSLAPIAHFSGIIDLNVSLNHLTEIDGLTKLTKLTSLNLSSNLLQSCDGLIGLRHLQSLQLQYNRISSLASLKRLRETSPLQYLDIRGNRFNPAEEAQAIESLAGLATLLLHPLGDVQYSSNKMPRPSQILLPPVSFSSQI